MTWPDQRPGTGREPDVEVVGGPPGPPWPLTDRDRAILEFERRTTGMLAGDKEALARQTFEFSSTRYYQILNALLDQPAAAEYDPELVGRLRRLREQRASARSARA